MNPEVKINGQYYCNVLLDRYFLQHTKQFRFFYTFQQNNAPAHRDCKMVEFLAARETPAFIIFELLGTAEVNNLLHLTK